ncbi:MAG: HypC/HybG/HupF family hydrogenase formation chaperone [Proteobacteria bacterium]|nr:HypC/HybG/HupF family hydrogenase formation chaperone [Pseudomonadota bacterium]
MCLGIPMQVKSINQFQALCEAKGIQRDVSLFMLQGETIIPGDYVVVSVGYAIEKISSQEAQSAWEIYDQMLAAEDGLP